MISSPFGSLDIGEELSTLADATFDDPTDAAKAKEWGTFINKYGSKAYDEYEKMYPGSKPPVKAPTPDKYPVKDNTVLILAALVVAYVVLKGKK